jgi:hypothetical protein
VNKQGENVEKQRFLPNTIRLVSYLLILLPAALGVLYVRAFGVNVVFGDAWSMVRLFEKWSSGTLTVSDFFRQHLEHRMFFPKGVEFLLSIATRYDNVAEMYLMQACFLVTLFILLLAFRACVKPSRLLLFVPISLLVFSFRQYENMLWGFQISYAFAQTFAVLALFLLYILGRRRSFKKTTFVAALGSATVASFSMAQGLLVWPAGLLQLFVTPLEKPTKRVLVVVWGLAGLGEWLVYFVDYTRPRNSSSLLDALYHPIVGAQYYLNLLGSPLFWRQDLAFVGGLLLACLALVSLFLVYKDRRLGEYSFWVSLLFFSYIGVNHARTLWAVWGFAGDGSEVHDLFHPRGGERLRDAGKDGVREKIQAQHYLARCFVRGRVARHRYLLLERD